MRKWHRKTFQGSAPFFFLPDICPQNILLVVCPMQALNGAILSPLQRQGAAGQALEVAQFSMRHCSFWLSTMSLHPSWDPGHFPSLVVIRTGTNMRGQHLIRASPEKFAGFQCNGPFPSCCTSWSKRQVGLWAFLNLLFPEMLKGTVKSCTPHTEIPERLHTCRHSSARVAQLGTMGPLAQNPAAGDFCLKTTVIKSQHGISK